jgi:ubiquitin C-terminal hydrolase
VQTVNAEPFFMLDLPVLQNNCTLEDCLEHYILQEELVGDNAWYNESTKLKEDVIKQIGFWYFPNVLVISLKQFMNDSKVFVKFPLNNLNLRKYKKGYIDIYDEHDAIYNLYGVANHYGTIHGGHYTAFVKIKSGQWVHFDDKYSTFINDNDVITSNAYCLFYVKI